MENNESSFRKKLNAKVENHPLIKKILGVVLLLVGFIALITPFTPGAIWLMAIGLQLLGVNFLLWSYIEQRLPKRKPKNTNQS